jgi:hypothetical protein
MIVASAGNTQMQSAVSQQAHREICLQAAAGMPPFGSGPQVSGSHMSNIAEVPICSARMHDAVLLYVLGGESLFVCTSGAAVARTGEEASSHGGAGAELEAMQSAASKRQRGPSGQATPSAVAQQSSQQQLSGHNQCVASLAWPSQGTIVSGSWDHSVCGSKQNGD